MPSDLDSFVMFTLALSPLLFCGLLVLGIHFERKPERGSKKSDKSTTEK